MVSTMTKPKYFKGFTCHYCGIQLKASTPQWLKVFMVFARVCEPFNPPLCCLSCMKKRIKK